MLPPLRDPVFLRRLSFVGWIIVAALPVLYIALTAITFSRNIVFWDEFDTALDLILRLDAGADWSEILHRFFALNNEHRTVTSRVMFAVSYWLTGTVNFHVIGAIGNLFLVGACTILIFAVTGTIARVRMAVVLAFLMFQLEHFESFIWSGSSIDHFQVVTLGVGAIAALARRTRFGLGLGIVLGFLATFTLAQGSVVWPAGVCLLAYQKRWRELAVWLVCGAASVTGFLQGFTFNPGHNIATPGRSRIVHVIVYWVTLLGGPLTLGDAGFAPVPGLLLLIGFGIVILRGGMQRQPVAFFSAVFAVGALALIAFGRSELAGNDVNSRYLVLGALAWAMLIFLLLDLLDHSRPRLRPLLWLTPALIVFNVCANLKFAPLVEIFVEVRDRAATSFMQYQADGRGITRLHPQNGHADVLLKMAAERGVYRLPPVSHLKHFPRSTENRAIITHLDELVVNEHAVTAGGWAMIPGHVSRRDQIHVVLRSTTTTLIYSTVTLLRPDVAKAYGKPEWYRAGFRAVIERSRLPAEDFEVGVLIADRNGGEFLMSGNRLQLTAGTPGRAITPQRSR